MPCFKGLAVSIHTPNNPLPEYAVQRSSRLSRITSYIPVPPAQVNAANQPEQSSFAISITLLTPGLDVPYSAPKATLDDLNPQPKTVGGLPGFACERGRAAGTVAPYIPLTTSPNETIAAYIYFDGRAKEEVATLLRRGEETWVNSRWVGVAESEGGGLAEREFLFREVGLERWLNGLDLDGKDAAAKIEKRRQRMARRRKKRKSKSKLDVDEASMEDHPHGERRKQPLRYRAYEASPLESVSDDEGGHDDDDDGDDDHWSRDGSGESDDDDPIPETAGQIKVALFRVLASGEIKRGEYSPQFDAHDDDDESHRNGGGEKQENGQGADVDHTTSFAKPKSLDPKSISTQTVTGIDAADKPYAVFTFLYRGERQLQKMGILDPPKSTNAAAPSKRKSLNAEFASLGPLKKEGTVGFSTFRDHETRPPARRKESKKEGRSEGMDSESEDDADRTGASRADEVESKPESGLLSSEDAQRGGELAEAVRKIKLKRQHSADPLNGGHSTGDGQKLSKSATPSATSTPQLGDDPSTTPSTLAPAASSGTGEGWPRSVDAGADDQSALVGSPMKKQRASLAGAEADVAQRRLGGGMTTGSNIGSILGSTGDGAASPLARGDGGGSGSGSGVAGSTALSPSLTSSPTFDAKRGADEDANRSAMTPKTANLFGAALPKKDEEEL